MFQFPGFALNPYGFRVQYLHETPCSPTPPLRMGSEYKRSKVGFPIRKSLDQSLFAAPQGLSQRTTSFIASQRQGIHRMPLRHLIALMIDVRHSAAADPISERPFALRLFSPRACLPNTSDQRLNLKPPWPLNDTIAQRSDMFPLYDVKHPPAAFAAAANS
jgi:hypothetical protein